MTRCKLFTFIKFMTLWNNIHLLYNNTTHSCSRIFNYMKDYYYGYNDVWLFVTGHTFPISLNNVSNNIAISWVYDNYDNTLTFATSNNIKCKISWLSCIIKIDDNKYEIDDFIEKLSINMDRDPPSLHVLFMSWCAYKKQWFNTDNISFNVIDHMGNNTILNLNNKFIIQNNKLYNKN